MAIRKLNLVNADGSLRGFVLSRSSTAGGVKIKAVVFPNLIIDDNPKRATISMLEPLEVESEVYDDDVETSAEMGDQANFILDDSKKTILKVLAIPSPTKIKNTKNTRKKS